MFTSLISIEVDIATDAGIFNLSRPLSLSNTHTHTHEAFLKHPYIFFLTMLYRTLD
jgi:hypothetical protein